MGAVVSSRILRLQAISPRSDNVGLPPGVYASPDVVLINGANMTIVGHTATKTSGAATWDASVYSKDGFTGGAYASCRVRDAGDTFMIALNSDPTTDSGYSSLDYAMYCYAGALHRYLSGSGTSLSATCSTGDILAVTYDGWKVRWFKNGTILDTVTVGVISSPLFFDSSFAYVGEGMDNIRFGPMTNVYTAALINGQGDLATMSTVDTPEIDSEAASSSYSSENTGTVTLGGNYTGSSGAPTYTDKLFHGSIAVATAAQLGYGQRTQISGVAIFNAQTNARTMGMAISKINYSPSYSSSLGSMTVTVVSYGGYNCLRFDYGTTLPSWVTSAAAGACLLVVGQPVFYVYAASGQYIYASPNNTPSAGEAWLLGSGTYPATLSVTHYGDGSSGNNFSAGVTKSMYTLATQGSTIMREYEGNVYQTLDAAFLVTTNCWPTLYTDGYISHSSSKIVVLKR